ncbi:MAG: hypothetical protein RR728_03310, partial [Oscillospiraceae bacterium]
FLVYYSRISWYMAQIARYILELVIPKAELGIAYGEFLPLFGGVYSVQLPGKMPSVQFILVNMFAVLVLLLVCAFIKGGGKAAAVFISIALGIHFVSCIYFLFWGRYFPYTLSEYSDLYMKQQISIWLTFMVITGMATGLTVNSGIKKYLAFIATMAYSFVFGCVRYVGFLFLLNRASSLYMAALFFSFGPFFDFLYLVFIYSYFIKRLIIHYEAREREVNWQWM